MKYDEEICRSMNHILKNRFIHTISTYTCNQYCCFGEAYMQLNAVINVHTYSSLFKIARIVG